MDSARVLRHLTTGQRATRRKFPVAALLAIETAIQGGELRHSGEVRFAVEHALEPMSVLRGETPRERAVAIFTRLRVWDTEHNSGVLIYVLLADHAVEIVADRGIHKKVAQEAWQAICRHMETEFRAGRFEAGALGGIVAVHELLARHFPASARNPDELPNRPVVL